MRPGGEDLDRLWRSGEHVALLAALEGRTAREPHEGDPALPDLQVRRARALWDLARYDEAEAEARRALEAAERSGGLALVDALDTWADHARTEASSLLARASRIAAQLHDPVRHLRVSLHLVERRMDRKDHRGGAALLAELAAADHDPRWTLAMGRAAALRGDAREARAWFDASAASEARDFEDERNQAYAVAGLGRVAVREGDLPLATTKFSTALESMRHRPFGRVARIVAWRGLARVARQRGDLDDATALLRLAIEEGTRAAGDDAEMDLAMVLVEAGRVEEARGALEAMSREGPHDPARARLTSVCLAAVAARTSDTRDFDLHFRVQPSDVAAAADPSAPALDADEEGALDLARMARLAATYCAAKPGWVTRSLRARAVALASWDRLGRTADSTTERQAIRRLGDRGARPRLGPFILDFPIARGAFGQVWRARHDTGAEVAIKVLTERGSITRLAIDRELRAVATLDHPNVVRLLHHGVTDRAAETLTPELLAGSPWLAMELADGTLEPHLGRWPWSRVEQALTEILAALAHAHSRGLLHLDVKPGNVLLAGDTTRLTDFGLATAFGSGVAHVAGTPEYMAPEQFRGREIGPWTDLYAVGCLAVAMAQGTPPYVARSPEEARRLHYEGQPDLAWRIGVPSGFAAWVRRLLTKRPHDRFRHAVDAATTLQALGPASVEAQPLPPRTHERLATTVVLLRDASGPPILEVAGERSAIPAPSVHPEWRRPMSEPPPALTDAGLGLFSVRAAPFVGRTDERSALWSRLRLVASGQQAACVGISAEPGYGASALASWFCERAMELGAASVLSVGSGVQDAARGLARLLGCAGLEEGELVQLAGRVHPGVRQAEARLLADVLLGDGLLGRRERRRVLTRAITRESKRRPLIVWLDRPSDASLRLAQDLLLEPNRVLILITGAPDGSLPKPNERLTLTALPPSAHRELLDAHLPLEPSTRDRIATLTAGDPRFAVQLLTDLASSQGLTATQAGWALPAGAPLPDSLERLWERRLMDVLAGLSPDAIDGLRVAALLEPVIDDGVWQAACRRASVRFPPEAREALLDARLARQTDRGWVFEDPALRTAAIGNEDPSPLHLACAEAIEDVDGAPAEAARHYQRTDLPDRAATACIRAIASESTKGRSEEVLALCDELETIASSLDPARRVTALFETELARGDANLVALHHEAAEVHLQRAHALAMQGGVPDGAAKCVVKLAGSYRQRKAPAIHEEELRRIAGARGPYAARAELELGRIQRDRGRPDLALVHNTASHRLAVESQDADAATQAESAIGSSHRRAGRPDLALPLEQSARDAMRAKGHRFNDALLSIDVAASLLALGRSLEAEAELLQAEDTLEVVATWAADFAATRRALIVWTAGRREEGDAIARRLGAEIAVTHVARLVWAADRADVDWAALLDLALTARKLHSEDVQLGLRLADARATAGGFPERSTQIRSLKARDRRRADDAETG